LKKHCAELGTEYKYTARTESCQYEKTNNIFDKGYKNVQSNSVTQLKAAIADGPVSVTVEADTSVFQRYTSGILNSKLCGTSLDHAITAVGYGNEGDQEYYIVRNSWGAGWGQ